MLLGEILVQKGFVTEPEVQAALDEQQEQSSSRRLGQLLLERGGITEYMLLEALGQQFSIEVIHHVDDHMLDPELVGQIPVDWSRSHELLPIRLNGKVSVLTSDPMAISDQDNVGNLLGVEPIPILAPSTVILKSIEHCYYQKTDSTQDLINELETTSRAESNIIPQSQDLLRIADHAPVVQLVNLILLEALKSGASDIHMEPLEDRLRVRCRIDGNLYEQPSPPKHLEAALISRLKVMGQLDIAEKRLPQDGTARVHVGARDIDIRISTVPVAEGERLVLRLLNRNTTLRPLQELGMSSHMLETFQRLLKEPHGIIWVTGPTGSGKTTTLYSALQELDTQNVNVLTIEDPVEYQLSNIGQIGVKPKIGLTFSMGLRHILRQDPDIILVGETRDLETAEIVIRASLTGHLVFSTLHTNDAANAVVRLIDMGVEPYLVASSSRASLAQRLVRQLCSHCKVSAPLEEELALLGPAAKKLEGEDVCKPKGCPDCLGGYKGRIAIFEILLINEDMVNTIRAGMSPSKLKQKAIDAGMKTLLDDGLDKVVKGLTSIDEVMRVTK